MSPGTSGNAGQWAGTTTALNQGFAANGGIPHHQFYVPLTATGTALFANDTTDFVVDPSKGGAIYSFFSQTHYTVGASAPLADMNSFVLQLEVAAGLTGAFGGTAQDLAAGPSLRLTLADSSILALAPNFSRLQDSSTFSGTIATTFDSLGYQWDLSAISQPISSYTVDFQAAFHAEIFGADVTESSAIHTESVLTPIPEPGTALFGVVAVLGLCCTRRQRMAADDEAVKLES